MMDEISRFLNRPDFSWILLGLFSQFFFFLRFLIQWIATEIKKESTIPPAFWYLSVLGAIGLLVYAIYRKDPVFILGPVAGLFVYLRNIYFLRKKT